MSDRQPNSAQMSTDAVTLRKRAEEQVRTMEPTSLSAKTPEAIERMLYELRVHQIELEMQNEELLRAQSEIEAGRARYFDLYDLAPVGYCTLSEKGLILEANLTAATLLGTVRGDLIKKPISRFILKDDQDIYYLHRNLLFETGESQECDLRLIKADGTSFWALLKGNVSRGKDGAPECLVTIGDISERKRAESIIKKDEQNLRNIADAMQETLSVIALDGTFLYANQKAAWNMSGEEYANIIGTNIRELIPIVQAEALIERYLSVYQSGKPFQQEIRVSLKKGDTWFFNTLKPIEYGSPPAPAVLSLSLDITERKRAEEALLESEKFLQILLESLPIPVFFKDAEGRYSGCNKAFETFFGKSRSEFIGCSVFDINPPELARIYHVKDLELYERISTQIYSSRVKNAYDELRDVVFHKATLTNASGAISGLVGAIMDITETKQAEAEREKLHVQLQQAQKIEAIGTLAGGIAHDFNNILGAILGFAEMAQEDSPAGSMLRKDIEQVITASHRAKALVQQILAFSHQAETKRIPLQPAPIIREALKMLRSSLPSTIAIQQDMDLEAGPILADPTQIHQVITNLCTNAFHAMEETGGRLDISLKTTDLNRDDLAGEPQVVPGRFVQLSITDTGPGIAPEIRERIFDPYFTTKEVGKGTGMGLAMVHGIAKSCNGFVSCRSVLGQGAAFHVYLPVVAEPASLELLSAPSGPEELGNERILLVDDEEILAEIGKVMLERLGYRVTVRRNSLDALNTFQNQPDQFDLVITDQTMPGMTGVDMARRMLQIRPGMPIILCTGYSSLISKDRAKTIGIKGFAMKPLAKKDIAVLIREVLGREETARAETRL
jgi:PAS domain S-box-containing protein